MWRVYILPGIRLVVPGEAISNFVADSLHVLNIEVEPTQIFHPPHLAVGQPTLGLEELKRPMVGHYMYSVSE
jgi:hypothetical protein